VTAQNPTTDFETLGRQVWEAWSRQWSGAAAKPAIETPLPGMDGLKSYLDWMQQAAASMTGPGGHVSAPMPAFAGWTMPGAAPTPTAGLDALRGLLDMPTFGHTREQQAQQQELMRALLDHQQASARYQQLVARAQAEGMGRAQRKLAEPGVQVGSLKAMYDLWVDAVEEAYAEIALSDEFREVYAVQANTQMRVRQLQQQQMEQWCREMGLPTRSEVATLGQRLQELRRELQRTKAASVAKDSPSPGRKDVKAAKRGSSSAMPGRRARATPAAKAATTRRTPRKPR
jgi:hypothetical protein